MNFVLYYVSILCNSFHNIRKGFETITPLSDAHHIAVTFDSRGDGPLTYEYLSGCDSVYVIQRV